MREDQRYFRGKFVTHVDGRRILIKLPHMMTNLARIAPTVVHFHRKELSLIISLYGQMVAIGEWRDYAISALSDKAVFSVFRRTAEHPLYRIEKCPKLSQRQGAYSVIGLDGRILKRGHDLRHVLRVFDRKLIRAAP